jgi:hypothetical protein
VVYVTETLNLLNYIEDGYADERTNYDGTEFFICDVDGLRTRDIRFMNIGVRISFYCKFLSQFSII